MASASLVASAPLHHLVLCAQSWDFCSPPGPLRAGEQDISTRRKLRDPAGTTQGSAGSSPPHSPNSSLPTNTPRGFWGSFSWFPRPSKRSLIHEKLSLRGGAGDVGIGSKAEPECLSPVIPGPSAVTDTAQLEFACCCQDLAQGKGIQVQALPRGQAAPAAPRILLMDRDFTSQGQAAPTLLWWPGWSLLQLQGDIFWPEGPSLALTAAEDAAGQPEQGLVQLCPVLACPEQLLGEGHELLEAVDTGQDPPSHPAGSLGLLHLLAQGPLRRHKDVAPSDPPSFGGAQARTPGKELGLETLLPFTISAPIPRKGTFLV